MHKSLKRKHNVTVKAVGGSTVKHMEHYSKPPLERNPELVILPIGTNDINTDQSPSEIASNKHDLENKMGKEKEKLQSWPSSKEMILKSLQKRVAWLIVN